MFGKFSLSGTAADDDDCHSAVVVNYHYKKKRKDFGWNRKSTEREKKQVEVCIWLTRSTNNSLYVRINLNPKQWFVFRFLHLPSCFSAMFCSFLVSRTVVVNRANRTSCWTFRLISIHRETFPFIHRNHGFHWASWFTMGAINKLASLVNQSIDVSIAYFKENAVAILALILLWRYLRGSFNDRCKHYKYQLLEPWPCCARVNSFSLSNILVVTTFFFQIPTAGRPKDIPYLRRPQNQKQSKIAIVKKKWEKLGNVSKKLPTNAPKRRPF